MARRPAREISFSAGTSNASAAATSGRSRFLGAGEVLGGAGSRGGLSPPAPTRSAHAAAAKAKRRGGAASVHGHGCRPPSVALHRRRDMPPPPREPMLEDRASCCYGRRGSAVAARAATEAADSTNCCSGHRVAGPAAAPATAPDCACCRPRGPLWSRAATRAPPPTDRVAGCPRHHAAGPTGGATWRLWATRAIPPYLLAVAWSPYGAAAAMLAGCAASCRSLAAVARY